MSTKEVIITTTPSDSTSLLGFAFKGHVIRGGLIDGQPVFVAQDICEAMEIKKHRDAIARIPNWAQGRPVTVDALATDNAESQEMATLTEAGVYYLVLRSNKPEADAFQKWVCTEVLPSLRKTGTFTLAVHVPDPQSQLSKVSAAVLQKRMEQLIELGGPSAVIKHCTALDHILFDAAADIQRALVEWRAGAAVWELAQGRPNKLPRGYRQHLRFVADDLNRFLNNEKQAEEYPA